MCVLCAVTVLAPACADVWSLSAVPLSPQQGVASTEQVHSTRAISHTARPARILPHQTYDESDWNEKSTLKRNPYYYSKTLAEKAAWDFVEKKSPGFSLVVINPFAILGVLCVCVYVCASSFFLSSLFSVWGSLSVCASSYTPSLCIVLDSLRCVLLPLSPSFACWVRSSVRAQPVLL